MGCSALVRYVFEPDWGFFTSAYFLWITFTSIGLGDFGPGDNDMIVSPTLIQEPDGSTAASLFDFISFVLLTLTRS